MKPIKISAIGFRGLFVSFLGEKMTKGDFLERTRCIPRRFTTNCDWWEWTARNLV